MIPESVLAIAAFMLLHVGGIACAVGTRIATGSRAESAVQLVFLFAMGAVGLAAWCCRQHDLGLAIPSQLTLITMVVLAVVDLRRTHEPAAGFATRSS